ncbi:GTPase-activating protein [Lithospermum erythrorhizon]|uniref:GTPase-activating protein n=1 Tax=Lithospermum erythrorhizon TaxID=34254 RepID=A0AAV3PA58_LITER
MEATFVSRAKTAFHSAAAKAEKVLTDINKKPTPIVHHSRGDVSDTKQSMPEASNVNNESEEDGDVKNLRRRPAPIKTKYDWHQKFKNIRIGKKLAEDSGMSENSPTAPVNFDENLYMARERELPQPTVSNFTGSNDHVASEGLSDPNSDIIPPAASMKQLGVAIESGKSYKSIKDLMGSSRDSSPVRERASLSLSAMKSLVLREKQDELALEFGNNKKVSAVINSLLDTEGQFSGSKTIYTVGVSADITGLPKEIHGAPPDSFVVKVSEATGSLKTIKKMLSFWCRIITELKTLWSEGKYIPGIPQDEIPDLNYCLLYQQLQLINCCISRKRRKSLATENLDYILNHTSAGNEVSSVLEDVVPVHSILYAKVSTGEEVPRLGYDKHADNLTMLETGEPIYAPIMQEGPLLTEDLVKETEEFVLRTGSVGAGCSQLLSDMQAFKAANPGCILEDFVRWHSPPDWTENDTENEDSEITDVGDLLYSRGQLSCRMRKEGNLWRELWETAKPVPAVRQTPLFDEDLAVEGVLHSLEDIKPSDLFEQLFLSLLGKGFVVADAALSTNSSLSKIFHECRNYILGTCNGNNWTEKIEDICQVYETLETMVLNPDEVIRIAVQPEETPTGADLRNRFKKISLIFGSKDRNSGKTSPPSDQKNADGNNMRHSLSALFSKKPPKPSSASTSEKASSLDENDWTIV